MDKQTFIGILRSERKEWEVLFAGISEERMTQRNAAGNWSVKDILAHTTTWERWAANQVRASLAGRKASSSELFGIPISAEVDALDEDEFNEWMVEHSRALSLAEVWAASRQAFADLLETIHAIPEEDLIDPERQFVGLEWKGQRPLWDVVANQSYLHYQLHATSLWSWLLSAKE